MTGDDLIDPPDDGQPFDPYYSEVEPAAPAPGVAFWANSRVRNGLIAAAVVAVAVVVIGANDGGAGDDDSALRSRREAAAATTTTTTRERGDEDEDEAVRRRLRDVTTPGASGAFDDGFDQELDEFDDEFATESTFAEDDFFDDEFATDSFFDDDDDFFSDDDDDDDDDFFNVRPSTNRPRPRVPFVPRATTPEDTEPDDSTTSSSSSVADTTTSSSSVVDTTTSSSTPTSSTETTLAPAAAWAALTQGLVCTDPVVLLAGPNGVLAGLRDDELFGLTGDAWGPATATVEGQVRAVVAHPSVVGRLWVGGSAGVFRLDGVAVPVEVGALSDVVSLAIDPTGATVLAATPTTVHRSDGTADWQTVTPPLATDETITAVYVHDADTAFLGTNLGVKTSTDGGLTWSPVPNMPGVVGRPVVVSDVLTWLRRDGLGVLRWSDAFGWTSIDDAADAIDDIPVTTARLVALPDGRLVTVGAGKLIASADGAAWTDFGPALPTGYQPAGVARAGTATFVWAPDCRTDFILRLPD